MKDVQPKDFAILIKFDAVRREHIQDRLRNAKPDAAKQNRDSDIQRWLLPDRLVPIDGEIKK